MSAAALDDMGARGWSKICEETSVYLLGYTYGFSAYPPFSPGISSISLRTYLRDQFAPNMPYPVAVHQTHPGRFLFY